MEKAKKGETNTPHLSCMFCTCLYCFWLYCVFTNYTMLFQTFATVVFTQDEIIVIETFALSIALIFLSGFLDMLNVIEWLTLSA